MHKDMEALASDIVNGNRRALSRAITLVESTRPDHRQQADQLLELLLPRTGNSLRIGITGVPGVGKSTFIEAIGEEIIEKDHKLAVLAIDPSSALTGGSILGDKTRMENLAQRSEAFIRPSPSGNTPGGVARRSFETLLLCEAAGYDIIIVETVGVGQAETRVSQMTDLFLLLLLPGGGDELQGIKRGIMELADIIVVNKADGAQVELAEETARDYRNALKLLRPNYNNWSVPINTCSALEKRGVADIWEVISAFREQMSASDQIEQKRREQGLEWMWAEIADSLIVTLRGDERMKDLIEDTEKRVRNGHLPAPTAANRLVQAFLNGANKEQDK